MNRVLLIDDDVELSLMLADYIAIEGFEVVVENNPEIGLIRALSDKVDIVVLDVMMPKMDGIEVLREIRKKSKLPILMLTAKGDDDHRIIGLELGADDYVPKPCKPREVVARIRAILRRVSPETDKIEKIKVGNLLLLPNVRRAEWNNRPLELTSTEFNLLLVLAKQAGKIVKKEDLCVQALGRPLAKFDRSIDVHMSSIRQKLGGENAQDQCIQTIYRLGYQMVKE
jgi:two-component system, OmpR family, response regulator